jgi:RimJ/RimL family protein N-acetyltransferase
MSISLRTATTADLKALQKLYIEVRGRVDDDIAVICECVLKHGHCEVAVKEDKIICAVSAVRLGVLNSLAYTLTDLTMVLHPDYTNQGFGKEVLLRFLEQIEKEKVYGRVEVMICASNVHSIEFYESVGFKKQGRFEKRIKTTRGWEDDIPMGWLNPSFQF